MTLLPPLAFLALKRKLAAMDKRALPGPSIVGSFFLLPWPAYAVGTVAPEACHLALVAARAPRAGSGEDAQNDSTHATIRREPVDVGVVGPWPRCGVSALRRLDESSDSLA